MTVKLEYDRVVPRWIPASVVVFGLLALPLLFVSGAHAQINGTPASVTSPGFGGRAVNGTPPSVTSLGRSGFAPPFFTPGFAPFNPSATFSTNVPHHHDGDHDRDGHHHRRDRDFGFAYPYYYAVPYAVDNNAYTDEPDADADTVDADYQGGPTIFDRRGAGATSYVPPAHDAPVAHSNPAPDPPQPESPQVTTTLVFKDGHQLDVGNYAIVGQTLYDLTAGHPRKIALADLDLPATEKQNDDRGVMFQVPPSTQAN
jgi:hypothetical protein